MSNINNISLIGMAACGKSTAGVLLAKALNKSFIDTDLIIQQKYKKSLPQLLESDGIYEFIQKEEKTICGLRLSNACVSTGGSVIYSSRAMEHLKKISVVVYIQLPFEIIEKRIKDIKSRGVVIENGKTLKDLYSERVPLYEKYANITVNAENKILEETVEEIIKLISGV